MEARTRTGMISPQYFLYIYFCESIVSDTAECYTCNQAVS
jgi:hypothetical protein